MSINATIEDWENDHPGYRVGFNGRSSGYLVLYREKDSQHCFEEEYNSPCKYNANQYEDWKADVKTDWGSLKNYRSTLIEQVKLVQDFDLLCDDLVEVVKSLIDDMLNEKACTHSFTATKTYESYSYDTERDMFLHKQYMLEHGHKLIKENKFELTATYEFNEQIEDTVVISDND